jgi:uncharacterized membrane protein
MGRIFYIAVVTFLAVISTLSYWAIQSGQRDAYTVLYFTNPLRPILYDASSNTLIVNFTVENHENRDSTYTYVIRIFSSENIELASKDGDVKLGREENVTVSDVLSIAKNPVGGKLYVELYLNTTKEPYRMIWQRIR